MVFATVQRAVIAAKEYLDIAGDTEADCFLDGDHYEISIGLRGSSFLQLVHVDAFSGLVQAEIRYTCLT